MRRRAFLLGLPPALMSFPVLAQAETAAKRSLVGFIVPGTPELHGKWLAALTRHMEELGWVDGKTVTLDFRYAAGKMDLYQQFGATLAGLRAKASRRVAARRGGRIAGTPRAPLKTHSQFRPLKRS